MATRNTCNLFKFKQKVNQGQFYVCVVCNRFHYDENVIIFKSVKYSHDYITKIKTNVSSFTFVKHVMLLLKKKKYNGRLW